MGLSLERWRRLRRRRPTPGVEECRAERDYSLWLVFEDGLEGRVYLGDLLEIADFIMWRDVDSFLDVSVDPQTGAVQWGDRIKLDPGVLYRDVASRVRASLH